MAGLIKNQILKHLSKFTKNLSPDKIHVSTLKGEGDLSNLELDEDVLTELLDLPTWLKITRAVCNRVAIKIQWTKLKSQPICLFLDEIEVEMVTLDDIRTPSDQSPLADLNSQASKYGLAERIVDGMYVSINSVMVNFKAKAFSASCQFSRILIQSKTPIWEKAGDLRLTRIKDELRGEILLFKEAEWQTLRVEANALEGSGLATTPLRLIANQSKVRITLKKKLVDCGVIASKLHVSLDDLLWVLTDSQLKAALTFVNSLKDVIQKSSLQSKHLAAKKVKEQGFTPTHHPSSRAGNPQQRPGTKGQQAISKVFEKYNISQTSYHIHSGRIDLHICDESSPEGEVLHKRVEGGAMQMTFLKMYLDYYPYHPAGAERSHWLKYDENMASRSAWAEELLQSFRDDVQKVRSVFSLSNVTSPATETAQRGSIQGGGLSPQQQNGGPPGSQQPSPQQRGAHRAAFQAAKHTRLLENSFVFRLNDFLIYQVSSATDNRRKVSSATDNRRKAPPSKFLASEKKALWLPPEMSSLHVEFTDYYFPEGIDFPVPPPNMFIVVNPIKITLDYLTLMWLNAFSLNISNSLHLPEDTAPKFHTDIRLDALMPRLVLPAEQEEEVTDPHDDRPNGLQVQMSRVMVTNVRQGNGCKRENLRELVEEYTKVGLFNSAEFPRGRDYLASLPACMTEHAHMKDCCYFDHTVQDILLNRDIPRSFSEESLEDVITSLCTQQENDNSWSFVNGTDNNGLLVTSQPPEQPLNPLQSHSALQKRRRMKYQDSVSSVGLTYYNMRTDSFKTDVQKDVWCAVIEQVWVEFIGVPSVPGRPLPLIESFPLTLWLFRPSSYTDDKHHHSNPTANHICDDINSKHSKQTVSTDTNQFDGDKSNTTQTGYNTNNIDNYKDERCIGNVNSEGLESSDQEGLVSSDPDDVERKELEDKFDTYGSNRKHDTADKVPQGPVSDLHLLTNVRGKVNVQINHYQYLFLMRLIESVTLLMDEIQVDAEKIMQKKLPKQKIGVTFMLKEAEIALIGRPSKAEFNSDDLSPDNSSDMMTDDLVSPTKGEEFELKFARSSVTQTSGVVQYSASSDNIDHSPSSDEETPIDEAVNNAKAAMSVASLPDITAIPADRRTSTQSYVSQQSAMAAGGWSRENSSPLIYVNDSIGNSGNFSQSDSPTHARTEAKKAENIKKSLNTGFTSLSKGFSSLKSNISDKVKQVKRDQLDPDDLDDWETMSVQSSDDEDFMLLKFQHEEELPAFDRQYGDVGEGESESPEVTEFKPSGNTASVVTFKVTHVEASVQIVDKDISVSAEVHHLTPDELGNVNLDKFQENYSADHKARAILPERLEDPPVKLRFLLGPGAEVFAPTAGERGFLHCRVNNLSTPLPINALTSLTDLIEDEKNAPVIPLLAEVSNVFITLKDSTPPTYPDLIEDEKNAPVIPLLAEVSNVFITLKDSTPPTYPGSVDKVPLDVHVSKLVARRTEDGVFHLLGDTLEADLVPDSASCKQKCVQTTPSIEHPPTARTINYTTMHTSITPFVLHRAQNENPADAPESPAKDLATLQEENEQLRRQLERIGKLSSETGGIDAKSLESLQKECDHLRSKAHRCDKLQRENKELLEEMVSQADEVCVMKEERESLLASIQMLQEELEESENIRMRLRQEAANS